MAEKKPKKTTSTKPDTKTVKRNGHLAASNAKGGVRTKGQSINKTHTVKPKFPGILKECMGIVSAACAKAGINRKTYYDWRNADPQFCIDCDDVQEHVGDFVEGQLLKRIKEGQGDSVHFFCRTKLRNRGYSERTEITGANGLPIQSEHKAEIEVKILSVTAEINDIIDSINPGLTK